MAADSAIVQAATWTAIAAAGYLALGAGVTALRARPRTANGVLGLGLVVATAGGGVALAAAGDVGSPRPPAVSVDWPGSAEPGHDRPVVVGPGDSPWAITARRLDRPTPWRVAAAWPRWWQTNRAVVGPDPNLIRPGQRLRPPVPLRSRS
jgi:resuscitation-promoting factor RpfA